ncbi:TetR/AcrR family transcriptional regulator [Kitasatospora sp. NBC_01287]|uniref:TetR/AcrR family transcriptional regulator n=1 Tax=Kitasatospora sp. NBC_01287 TaxID=2903573 RepID=UPI00225066C1|nr:TetR family transcriptional regulator [Kitasatospora sp. NBC_01287]MCX4747639.1 TetR/AcrR family transcriptional regulator [Kitasatospora sp. NBC_01287]
MGLRELKKQQTRATLADTAMGLFIEHGFDHVTVAEVARAAGVSVNTVFNYFPTKEDLFFDRQAEVEAHLAEVVRTRPDGSSAAGAVRDGLLAALERDEPTLGLSTEAKTFWQVVADSPALQARGREIAERSEAALAAVLAEETGAAPDDPLPRMLAGAIAGTYRATTAEIRRRVVAGEQTESIRRSVNTATKQAFDLLRSGLESYPETAPDFH